MSEAVNKIVAEAIDLSRQERLEIAHHLLESIELEEPDSGDTELFATIEDRLKQIDDGTAVLTPHKELIENLMTELERRKAARQREQAT
jgi:hypothetical protein